MLAGAEEESKPFSGHQARGCGWGLEHTGLQKKTQQTLHRDVILGIFYPSAGLDWFDSSWACSGIAGYVLIPGTQHGSPPLQWIKSMVLYAWSRFRGMDIWRPWHSAMGPFLIIAKCIAATDMAGRHTCMSWSVLSRDQAPCPGCPQHLIFHHFPQLGTPTSRGNRAWQPCKALATLVK